MTDHVQPSPNETLRSYPFAGVTRHAADTDGWVVPAGEDYYATYMGLSGTPLNAFDHDSSSGLDVTIDTGEAFIDGKWLARDTQSTVTLADETDDQTVYVGWPADAGSSVTIGTAGDFPSDHGKLPIWDFDTAGGSVDSATDRRLFDTDAPIEPTALLPTTALDDGDSVEQRIPVEGGHTLTITGWGLHDTDETVPGGAEVQLIHGTTGATIASENTDWYTDGTGIASDTPTETVWYKLRLSNGTGTDYVDPDGLSAAFAYRVTSE